MLVSECMSKKVDRLTSEKSISDAAKMMEDDDIGALLVHDGDRLIGMVTDRDIVIRAISHGAHAWDPVSSVMTKKVLYCFEDDTIESVAENMARNQVHRLAVLNKDKRLVGIVSLGDLSTKGSEEVAAHTLCEISKPTHH